MTLSAPKQLPFLGLWHALEPESPLPKINSAIGTAAPRTSLSGYLTLISQPGQI